MRERLNSLELSHLARYIVKEARHLATSFCTEYNSSLSQKAQREKAAVNPAGSLNDDSNIRPYQNMFYESRAPWYKEVSDLIKYVVLPSEES